MNGESVDAGDQLSPVTLYREATGEFESYDSLPGGKTRLSLRDSAGRGETTISTADGESATATFEFSVDETLDPAGVGGLSLRVTPDGETPVLSAALRKLGPEGESTTLKDQVAVTEVERPGVVSIDLIGVESRLKPEDTLQLILGVDDSTLAPGLTPEYVYRILGGSSPKILNETVVAPYVPEDAPATDGLYFDSASSVAVNHRRRGESSLTLTTIEDKKANNGPIREKEAKQTKMSSLIIR